MPAGAPRVTRWLRTACKAEPRLAREPLDVDHSGEGNHVAPSSASSVRAPSLREASACSSSSADELVRRAPMICPPSKAISTTTRSSASAMDELREDTIDGVGMEERDLEPEQTPSRLLVDQLDALLGELSDRHADVSHLVGDVMHPRPAFAQELSHRGLLAERRQQLDAVLADPQRCRLDSLFGNRLPVLEPGTEKTLVRADGLIEVFDGNAEMVDPAGLHAGDATYQGRASRRAARRP